ncbi:MAG: hypothetical protein Kow0013_07730 [Pararhodobacter sp.]
MLHRAVRLPSRMLVAVRTRKGTFNATIGNISARGARLCGLPDRITAVGDRLDILVLEHRYPAEVRWQIDDTCGVMFARPLETGEIAAILGSRAEG